MKTAAKERVIANFTFDVFADRLDDIIYKMRNPPSKND